MTKQELGSITAAIRDKMTEQCDYLVALDARNGDGDLGISMRECWSAVSEAVSAAETDDLGMILLECFKGANRAAPSTRGTIMSFWMMGAAKALRGKTQAGVEEVADALLAGTSLISAKAGSKVGDKTVLDSIVPACEALKAHAAEGAAAAVSAAYAAAEEGMNSTKDMVSRHGRAAYYGEKSIGLIDGGAVAGKFIFEAVVPLYCR